MRLKGNPEAAVSAYRHAIAIDPDEFAACFNLAETLAELGQWQAATESYQQALVLKPGFSPALRGIVKALLHCGEYARWLEQDFDPAPDFFELYDLLGDALLQRECLPDAIEAFRKAGRIMPEHWQLQQKLARVLLKNGEFDAAENSFLQVIELNPEYSEAHDGLGDSCRQQHRWQEAVSAYRRACALDPEFHWHYFKLGEALGQLARWDQAANAYEQCYRIDPHLPGLAKRRQEAASHRSQWEKLEAYCRARISAAAQKESAWQTGNALSILLIATHPPHPPTGGATRIFEEIKYLGARHRLVVVCFHYSEFEQEIRQQLDRYCDFVFLTRPGGRYDASSADCPEKVKDLTTNECRNALLQLARLDFDLVLFDFIYAANYLDLFLDQFTILQEHNIESELLRQMADFEASDPDVESGDRQQALASESRNLVDFETRLWPRFSLRTTTGETDRQIMAQRCSGEILVVNNGVDTGGVLPVECDPAGPILFMGHMSYAPNIDAVVHFAEEVLPLLAARDAAVRFLIAGRNPDEAVMRLADHARIEVIANPLNMQSVAEGCCMTIVPLRMGSGTRLKILESLAMSLPVVSTGLGCEGLDLVDGEHLIIGDTPVDIADAVLRLRSDPDLAMRLRVNGRRRVKQSYDWKQIYSAFEQELVTRIERDRL